MYKRQGLHIPIIRIGRGSSKFFSNLVRSYGNNYDIVQVVAKGLKINLAVWVIYQLSNDFYIDGIYVNWGLHNISLSFFVYTKEKPVPIQRFVSDDNQYYIKVGKNSDEETLHRLINKQEQSYLIAAGSSCFTICQLILYAFSMGFVPAKIEVIETLDFNGNKKAGLKVFIYRALPLYDEHLYSVPQDGVPETEMSQVLQES